MNGLGQRDSRLRRGFAVVGRQRNIALIVVKRRDPSDIPLAALLFIAPHRLGGPAQSRASERGLTLVDLLLRPRQSATDNVVEVGFNRPSRDLLFVNLDGVHHRLFHAVKIKRLVARIAAPRFYEARPTAAATHQRQRLGPTAGVVVEATTEPDAQPG